MITIPMAEDRLRPILDELIKGGATIKVTQANQPNAGSISMPVFGSRVEVAYYLNTEKGELTITALKWPPTFTQTKVEEFAKNYLKRTV